MPHSARCHADERMHGSYCATLYRRAVHDEPWEAVDWSAIPGPPTYRPEAVLAALHSLLSPKATDWADPATMLRFAAGNDHGGTIYPAGVAATVAMLEVIDMHPGDARRAALAVLLDWWVFDPEPGHEEYLGENNRPVNLVVAIQGAVLDASPMLERVASDPHDPIAGRLAAELILCARHGWGSFVHNGTVQSRALAQKGWFAASRCRLNRVLRDLGFCVSMIFPACCSRMPPAARRAPGRWRP
jgi:hypothetical protein